MIILDTNVISAVMKRDEEAAVISWLDRQEPTRLHITAVTVHELRYGVESLKHGRRRAQLNSEVEAMLATLANRVLPLDVMAARNSGRIQGERKRVGRPVDLSDCLIAGIAISHNASIATRNTRHFSDLPVEVINPWIATPD
jgi:predicted nucleic acid-binding protein